jgi:hypothetical protein
MLSGRFEKPVANWPKVAELENGGVHLTGKHVHPAWQRRAEYAAIAILIAAGILLAERGSGFGQWVGAMFVLLVFMGPVAMLVSFLFFRRRVDVKMDGTSIQIKGPLGYKRYSNQVRTEFRIDQHHKAAREEAKEIETGKKQRRTWRDAIEVVMQYGEKRVVVTEMRHKDIEKAKALLFRLGAISQIAGGAMQEQMSRFIKPAGSGAFGPMQDIR